MSGRIQNLVLDQPNAALVWEEGKLKIEDSSGRSYYADPLAATILLAMTNGSRLENLSLGDNSVVVNIFAYEFEGMPRFRFELFSPTAKYSHTVLVVNRSDIEKALVTVTEP